MCTHIQHEILLGFSHFQPENIKADKVRHTRSQPESNHFKTKNINITAQHFGKTWAHAHTYIYTYSHTHTWAHTHTDTHSKVLRIFCPVYQIIVINFKNKS